MSKSRYNWNQEKHLPRTVLSTAAVRVGLDKEKGTVSSREPSSTDMHT